MSSKEVANVKSRFCDPACDDLHRDILFLSAHSGTGKYAGPFSDCGNTNPGYAVHDGAVSLYADHGVWAAIEARFNSDLKQSGRSPDMP